MRNWSGQSSLGTSARSPRIQEDQARPTGEGCRDHAQKPLGRHRGSLHHVSTRCSRRFDHPCAAVPQSSRTTHANAPEIEPVGRSGDVPQEPGEWQRTSDRSRAETGALWGLGVTGLPACRAPQRAREHALDDVGDRRSPASHDAPRDVPAGARGSDQTSSRIESPRGWTL